MTSEILRLSDDDYLSLIFDDLIFANPDFKNLCMQTSLAMRDWIRTGSEEDKKKWDKLRKAISERLSVAGAV